ncbi:MAG TPA: VOC family protein [Terriglobales bacterium]|jgi:catechol 2,3-dioxygenase-like lactoylglutathione lyase family enzyme|nr:VOC family protein [Terriglobales bacterium]
MESFIAKLLQDFEQGKMNRRQLIQSIAVAATVAAGTGVAAAAVPDKTIVKATVLNHVSHPVVDYAKSRDWYSDLFGLKVVLDEGNRKANLAVGESLVILKNRTADELPVDHICFTIAGWDEDKNVRPSVEAELKRRGIKIERQTSMSFYIKDPDGFIVQIGGKDQ